MTSSEIRNKYLGFFKERGHEVIPSASLLPENDPTTLFTGSGMQPMVPYLLGEKHPLGTRIVNSQKCLRAEDIEEVGNNRHTTFFEMLGNWSLGDYFQEEQIPWVFEFLTKELKLDPLRIYVSVFRGEPRLGIPRDEGAVDIWKKEFKKANIEAKDVDFPEKNGMQGGRIFYYDSSKNWWSRAGVPENMPIGEPGGPDSEMFWDFGENLKLHENSPHKNKPCHINCDCGRFLEIGNNVFMSYVKTEKGFESLPAKNIDFGGGLERMAASVNNNPDVFLTGFFEPIIKSLEKMTDKKYGEKEKETIAFRVIADHIKAAVFLIADGALPSNKDQGYFTRRFIRRAVRYAFKLGVKENFCEKITGSVVDLYKKQYSELCEKKKEIFEEIGKEEGRFRETLERGLKQFEKISRENISGHDAFVLFSTFGFPIEMTVELANEKGVKVDTNGFKKEFEKHRELSRTAGAGMFKGGLADSSEETTKLHTATHLLLAALREVLGKHVGQKGSNITEKRLRLDFSHPEKLSEEEKQKVENLVNQKINENLPVSFEEMTPEEAKKAGAVGAFESKYGDKVKVYTVGNSSTGSEPPFSREICGGPHVKRTGELNKFRITKEKASSSGIRRIKAILE